MEELDRLLAQVNQVGTEISRPAADEVDRNARFPSESIDALRNLRLLSAYVPSEYGGLGLDVVQVARICEVLGQHCGSVAMIFAMHQIQVACIVHHATQSDFFRSYLVELVREQRLIASATTEVGTGGDLRASICAVERVDRRVALEKKAPVISYGAEADAILATSRRDVKAPANDQVMLLARRDEYRLEVMSGWDTLGFRGTCSSGFILTASVGPEQILPTAFSEVLGQTMHPFSHIVWGSLWLGIASDAVRRARAFVRGEARRQPGIPTTSSLRLAETDSVLQLMRAAIADLGAAYRNLLKQRDPAAFDSYSFAIRVNNLKLSSSTLVVDVVSRSMLICGIAGYRNDTKFSLGRHLRDAFGAALMVNNDRILNHNAMMQLTQRDE